MAQRNVKVGEVRKVNGEIGTAEAHIVNNIKNVDWRALTPAQNATRRRKSGIHE